ncbi:NAD-dependent DNA ligase LigA [Sulfidibacter corallicola]|uniref:DNA ligase n=1 Tax=Sulfidibacter corallicola TaxID=2818388 RepID=A0A8A4TXD5_SULCO|nr:NAD-dependent DNA ligase LigA [Sulfidibacter corallicola]QTD53774.1 NAD-dependent DNA ligase LigA [Sulfidibacter corallicola]
MSQDASKPGKINADQAAARMDELIEQIEYHRRRYYLDHDPEISDAEYDGLERELTDLERNFAKLVRPHSPSFRVGGGLADDHPEAAHRVAMLSLENSYNSADLAQYFERCVKAAGHELNYSAELKIDGVSLSLTYSHGVLSRAVTRGDGKVGEEVTLNAKTIRGLPLRVSEWEAHEYMEVRGEVYIDRGDFAAINEARLAENLPLFANPRNSAAGSMRLLDSREAAKRHLRIFVYQALGPWAESINSHVAALQGLHDLGFPVNPLNTSITDHAQLETLIEDWSARRDDLGYDTDGIVLKVDDTGLYDTIGYTTKFPKWATAFKFPAEQATTKILDISIQVGRTGVLTPVAHFEPVGLAGTTVARATLHNFDEIAKKDIRVGDWVFIEKGGDIIPKVVKVITARREEGVVPYQLPDQCPSCGTPPAKVADQVALRCENLSCPAQLERRIMHFASRNAMDIQGLGKERVQQMVELKLLTDLASIYRLDEEQLWKLERVGTKWIRNLLGEIEKSKQQPFARVLFAVGIPMIGEKVAELLIDVFPGYEALLAAEVEQLADIHGIGEKVARSLSDHLRMDSYRQTFAAFGELGLKLVAEGDRDRGGEQALTGKTVVVTGSFDGFSRKEATDLLKQHGAKVTSSVTKKTDLLVCGEKPGSKLDKAQALGVKVVGEEWLNQWQNT